MKKLFFPTALLSVMALCFHVTACGGGGDPVHPAARVEMDIWSALKKGNPEKAAGIIMEHHWSRSSGNLTSTDVLNDTQLASERLKEYAGGIKQVEYYKVKTADQVDPKLVDIDRYGDDMVQVEIKITMVNGEELYSQRVYVPEGARWARVSKTLALYEQSDL